MIKAAVAVAVLALASGALAQNTFCERYTGALFSSSGGSAPAYANATNQDLLVELVVGCAFTGTATGAQVPAALGGPFCGPYANVTGLYYDNLNGRYFNGTFPSGSPNYLDFNLSPTPAPGGGTYQLESRLVPHLVQFFAGALGCRAANLVNPYTGTVSMFNIHNGLGITQGVFNNFINQVAFSMVSYGVPYSLTATSDLAYVVARMGPFWRTPGGGANMICADPSCQLATGFWEFDTSPAGAWSIIVPSMTGTTITVTVGDAVHWNLGPADGVTQTATMGGTTPGGQANPITSGAPSASIRSFTWMTANVGTYYFYNTGTTSSSATVIVQAAAASSTAMTGMTGMTGMTMTGSMTGTAMTGTAMTGTAMTGTAAGGASAIAPSMMIAAATAAVVAALL